jgi:hypothetical protein
MSSSDRKIIHDVLAEVDGVTTPEGDDPQRCVVIARRTPDGTSQPTRTTCLTKRPDTADLRRAARSSDAAIGQPDSGGDRTRRSVRRRHA